MAVSMSSSTSEGFGKAVKIRAASEALTSQLGTLTRVIDPLMMTVDLISVKIIDRSLLEKVRLSTSTRSEKACDVLTAVSDSVETNPDFFTTFCDILDKEPVTKEIAKTLKEEYEKLLISESQKQAPPPKCSCSKFQVSFLDLLRKRLDTFNTFSDKKELIQLVIAEYVTNFIKAGCSSTKHLLEHLVDLYETEKLITDSAVYHWAKQLAEETFSEISLQSPTEMLPPSAKLPLFSKSTLYHACICSRAVNETNAGEYQKFFKDKKLVPGHALKEISISRSKQERYLIAKQEDSSTYYIAFQSVPDITEWPKKYSSFEIGIMAQKEHFPVHFITELLNSSNNRVVVTGFALGGLLASAIIVQIWQGGYIPAQLLQENLACITFAQPHLPVPQLAELAKDRPMISSTIHAVYYEEDLVPRMMRFLDQPCSTLIPEKEPGLQLKVQEPPKPAFQDYLTLSIIAKVDVLLSKYETMEVSEELKRLSEVLSVHPGLSQSMTYYQLAYSSDPSPHLDFSEMTQEKILSQSLYLKPDELQSTTLGHKHSMATYCEKLFCGYLDRAPEYAIPSPGQAPSAVANIMPIVTGITLHDHGSELALVLEGQNFWFCYRLLIHGESIDTPASKIAGTSIKLNFAKDSKRLLSSMSNEQDLSVKVFCHFSKTAQPTTLKVQKKEFPVNVRQRQLARLTPTQLMDLSYLSALLERHPYILGLPPQSRKVLVIKEFLEKVVDVVPLESVGFAIAYGNDHVADECMKVIDNGFDNLPISVLMLHCYLDVFGRIISGLPFENQHSFISLCDAIYLYYKCYSSEEERTSLFAAYWGIMDAFKQHRGEVPSSVMKSVNSLITKMCESTPSRIICDMNISCLYTVSQNGILQSPIETLHSGKKMLASLAENPQHENSDSSCSPRPSADMACLGNSLMLKTVNDIREKDLAICTSLLAGFMEHTNIDIPLMKSDKDRSKALELSARASVGVWALSSLNFEHIQSILNQCRGEQLLVKIEEYIKGIVEAEEMTPSSLKDAEYAAKLEFIVQGVTKTVTCNSQYISYSLERQLADICSERKITKEISLENLKSQWDIFFAKNILSLVPKTHRPLIARWLKWALMVHSLREELAKYTAVGVVGLVNSGKSQLITTLFGIQIPSGTTEENRTTVPFMYNLEERVDGLDVVDFPGVDDRDESISELADLLLTLAQIIIFVVDYRKVHTESSKKWLERLQEEKVPVMVCLTFADKLYGEHMTREGKHPYKSFMKNILQEQLEMIKKKLGLDPSSHQIMFCSFSQDNDSVLNCEEGRQKLRDVGISTPSEVGDWLVETFRKRFGQDDLADRLRDFVHSS